MRGRFNLFQAAMLRWRELHPYNAVHVVRVERALELGRLTAIIDRELEALGLTGYVLDRRRQRFAYRGGAAATTVTVDAGGDQPTSAMQRAVERTLNAAFEREGRVNPFRFFCIDNCAWFHLGLAYDHVVAGGDSIVVLMERIFAGYCGDARAAAPALPLDRYPPTYGMLFLRHWRVAARGIAHLREIAASCRRSVRPAYPRGDDPHNAFAYCRLDAAEYAALKRFAAAWGVTQNDLLLAILLKALDPLAGERRPEQPRHELAVASILNLRRDLGIDPNVTFGQFLSSFRVSHPVPPGISLEQLAREVRAVTAPIKRGKLYLQSLLVIAGGGTLWHFLSPARRQRFHAKNYPVWGALTMLDVNALWSQAGGPMPPPEYLRAVPTGPLAPVVVAATATGDVLHLGISYRSAAFSAENIDRMAAGILASARSLVR